MRASEKWLRQYQEENPERVSDPGNEPSEEERSTIVRARWQYPVLPFLMNEILSAFRYRPADYYKHRGAWEDRLALTAREEAGPNPRIATPTALTITRFSTGVPDADGLYGMHKPILDALVNIGLIPDDNPDAVGHVTARHEKVHAEDEQHVIIEIEPAAP